MMAMPRFASILGVTLGLGLLSGVADAADRDSFNALVGQGYELKSVAVVAVELAKRINPDVEYDTAVVSLQKGTSVAVCYFGLASWIELNKESLANPATCDVR